MNAPEINTVIHSEEDGVIILTLSNDPGNPTFFIIFQKDVSSTPSDIELGLDGCYVESSEIETSGYDVFTSYKIENSQLYLYKKIGDSVPNFVASIRLVDEELLILKTTLPKLLVPHP
jgi:hypothetical protein